MAGRQGWNLRGHGPRPYYKLEKNGNWKGDAAGTSTKRSRAQRMYALGDCERCGAEATDRHHVDGDTGNNVRANLEFLCRRCHMTVDGRLERFKEIAREQTVQQVKPPEPCINCGVPYKPRRKGRCANCDVFWRRMGRERQADDCKGGGKTGFGFAGECA